jgi:hypothetical protein
MQKKDENKNTTNRHTSDRGRNIFPVCGDDFFEKNNWGTPKAKIEQ